MWTVLRLAVDVEVEARDEEVLVERRVGALVDERAVGRLLALGEVLVTMIPVARTSHSMLPSW